MLKLLIADDERVIREALFSLTDWSSLGIEVIGLCKDGIEAYNMILDESPDLVLTDYRMPGFSGVELVREIAQTNAQIQFVILSGYGDFEYAQEAMKYGVKHYLLKPCKEEQLIETLQKAAGECREIKRQEEWRRRQNEMLHIIGQDAIYHILEDGLFAMEEGEALEAYFENRLEHYKRYQSFFDGFCQVSYLHYLEQKHLEKTLERMEREERSRETKRFFYGLYVKNTLLLFSYEKAKEETLKSCCGIAAGMVEIRQESFQSLSRLLATVLPKVKQYDVIYAIHDWKPLAILNHANLLRGTKQLCHSMEQGKRKEVEGGLKKLEERILKTSDIEMLRMLGNSICGHFTEMGVFTQIEEVNYFKSFHGAAAPMEEQKNGKQSVKERKRSRQESRMEAEEDLREELLGMLAKAQRRLWTGEQDYGVPTESVMAYVREHLSETNLTLKKIAEQHLYMNVDYVSRKFYQTTGKKFSQYLAEQRVLRGKELLLRTEGTSIQYVAEQVGCGNNPQYFSQIFKKLEGMTPGRWLEHMRKEGE